MDRSSAARAWRLRSSRKEIHEDMITTSFRAARRARRGLSAMIMTAIGLVGYTTSVDAQTPLWPVDSPDPLPGALLPTKRIVAFYGNPLSKRMGILGELPPKQMMAKLEEVARSWEKADSTTPVQPALEFITTVAQASPGRDGMYRQRMADTLVE